MKRLLPILATLALAACDSSSKNGVAPVATVAEYPTIQTVNYPLAYFAERIAGEHAKVVFAAPADGDPAFWKPSDAELSAFQQADLIVLNGADYAKWTKTASLSGGRIVDTSEAFASKYITVQETSSHSHGDGDAHAHAGTAFTTWLDFSQARQQAQAIADALSERLPANAETFQKNFTAFAADLDKLHADMQALAKKIGDQPLFASHPVYQYWSRAYDLNIKSLHWEPEVVPDDKALEELIEKSKGHGATWMIWEGVPAGESVSKIQHLKIRSVIFDPCGNRPDGDADWLSVMRQNLDNLEAAFGAP